MSDRDKIIFSVFEALNAALMVEGIAEIFPGSPSHNKIVGHIDRSLLGTSARPVGRPRKDVSGLPLAQRMRQAWDKKLEAIGNPECFVCKRGLYRLIGFDPSNGDMWTVTWSVNEGKFRAHRLPYQPNIKLIPVRYGGYMLGDTDLLKQIEQVNLEYFEHKFMLGEI